MLVLIVQRKELLPNGRLGVLAILGYALIVVVVQEVVKITLIGKAGGTEQRRDIF